MDKKDHNMRFISLDPADLRIEALAPEKNNADVFHTILFRLGEISYLMDVNAEVSALVLKNSITIPVALPYKKLEQMVYAPDFRTGDTLDLKPFTGETVKDVLVPSLADEFNAKSGLRISVMLRKLSSTSTIPFDFYESDIAQYISSNGTKAKEGLSVKIVFNSSVKKLPFGENKAFIDMSYEDFMREFSAAKAAGQAKLDLIALFAAHPQKYGYKPE
jgi:hypothetical protein